MWKLLRRVFEWLGNLGTAQGIPDQFRLFWSWIKWVFGVLTLVYAVVAPLHWAIKIPLSLFILVSLLWITKTLITWIDSARRPADPQLAFKGVCGTARWDGKQLRSADLVIENSGHPFNLVAVAKLVQAAPGLKFLDTDESRYRPRKVMGGKDATFFHVATVERIAKGQPNVVEVRGEDMTSLRAWKAQPEMWFDVRWTLMREHESMLSDVAVVTTRVTLAPNHKTFAVTVTVGNGALTP